MNIDTLCSFFRSLKWKTNNYESFCCSNRAAYCESTFANCVIKWFEGGWDRSKKLLFVWVKSHLCEESILRHQSWTILYPSHEQFVKTEKLTHRSFQTVFDGTSRDLLVNIDSYRVSRIENNTEIPKNNNTCRIDKPEEPTRHRQLFFEQS